MATISRTKIWHYVLNEGGQPIQNAEIRLYLQDSPTTESVIYATPSGGATTCSQADIKTDNDGYFEFWLEGETGTGGYAHTQEFILEWFKAGIAPGYVYNYNPWPNALVWRDTNIGADKTYENKFVSNYLVNKWYGHATAIVPSASPHDLYPVDYNSGCTDNTYNKVVSNKFIFDIRKNCSVALSGSRYYLNKIYGGVRQHTEPITSWSTSGDYYYMNISHPTVNGDSVVRVVNSDTKEEIVPAVITRLSANITRVAVDEDINAYVTIQGSE